MIAYNPKEWYKLILSFHKSDTFRMLLPAILGFAAFSAGLVYLGLEVWCWDFEGTIAIHSLLGFVISMLLVFRTNTAYDRWWEGRKLWGKFVNDSRNFSMKLSAFVGKEETVRASALLTNYFFACKDHLRKAMSTKGWVEIPGSPLDQYTNASHIPNALLLDLVKEVTKLNKRGSLSDIQFLMLNEELRSFADSLGACERISSTPIPYSYSMFIKKIIFFYSITIPFGILTEYHYWTVLITCFIFYAFASLELLAEEIEDPFGKEANDLPTDEIAFRIKSNIKEIFGHE
ncbi:MAG TPA: bestrophin family ion channel [Bacteroidia bacterium]|nr:bestrophin family ion channel [Bacteroidia bacterium]